MNRINKSNSPRSLLEFDSILYHHDGEDSGNNNIKHQLQQHQKQQQQQQQQHQQYDIIHHLEKLDTSSSESMAEMAIECIYIILSNDSKRESSKAATSETNQSKTTTTKPKTFKYSKEYKRTIQIMKDGHNNEEKEEQQQQQETKQQPSSSFEVVEEYRYFHILASIVHAMKRRQKRQHYLHSSLSSKFYSVSISCLAYCFQLSNNRSKSKTCSAVLLRQFITIGGIELVIDNIMKSYPTCLEIQINSFDLLMKLIQSYDYDDVTYNNNNNNNTTTIMENLFLGIVQAMMDIKYHPQQQQQKEAQYSKACNDIAKILLEKPYYRPYLIKTVEQVASSVVGYMKQIEQQQPVVKHQPSITTTTTMDTIDEEEQSTTKTSSASSTTSTMNEKQQHQKDNKQTQCIQKLSVCHDIIDITIRATVYIS